MTQPAAREDLATRTVLYRLPGMDDVTVRRDEPYKASGSGPLTMDVYYPPNSAPGVRTPAVLFGCGYSDLGYRNVLGCRFKEMGACVSWARLFAASGMAAIVYSNQQPVEDADDVLCFVQDNADRLGIDEARIGLWRSRATSRLRCRCSWSRGERACAARPSPTGSCST